MDTDQVGLKAHPELKALIAQTQSFLRAKGTESSDDIAGETDPRSSDRWGASDRSLVTFFWQDRALEMKGAIQPSSVHRLVYSGAVKARFRLEGFQPKPPGFPTEELARIPKATQRFMILDTRGLRLPESFQDKLSKEWKKWEFSPFTDLLPSLSSPFVLLESAEGSIFEWRLRSPKKVEAFLNKRYPKSVLKIQNQWSYGTKVRGFEKQRGPAWAIRSGALIATSVGGLERIDAFLRAKLEGPSLFGPSDMMAEEMSKLAGNQTGWNVCLYEHNEQLGMRWLLLLKWSGQTGAPGKGYLLVDVGSHRERTK